MRVDQRIEDLRRLSRRVDEEIVRLACGPNRALYARLATEAAAAFQISPTEIFSPDRHREIADARQVVFYLAHESGESYPRIGQAMGRDHTTVLSGYRRVCRTPRLLAVAERIAEQIRSEVAA